MQLHVDNEVECSTCNKVFPNMRSLKNHQNNSHRVLEYIYQCIVCPKSFKYANKLKVA